MSFSFKSSRYLRLMGPECNRLSPALVLLGQHDARGAGTTGTRFGDWVKANMGASILLFGGDPEKRLKYSASNF